jgi:hypothetical protein
MDREIEPAIMDSQKKKPPLRAALLVYCVVVFLLAGWPWFVWLIFGPTYAYGRKYRGWRLFAADTGQAAISSTQGIEEVLIACNCADALQEDARVVRRQHFGNATG